MHKELHGFDFDTGIYYFNVGEGPSRTWADFKRLGFISAGGEDPRWRDAINAFKEGGILAAYLKGEGFVGIGRIKARAQPIRHVAISRCPILDQVIEGMKRDLESDDKCEHVALVEWIKAMDPADAKWASRSGLYTTTLVRASLAGQPRTLRFLDESFGVNIKALLGPRAAISDGCAEVVSEAISN